MSAQFASKESQCILKKARFVVIVGKRNGLRDSAGLKRKCSPFVQNTTNGRKGKRHELNINLVSIIL